MSSELVNSTTTPFLPKQPYEKGYVPSAELNRLDKKVTNVAASRTWPLGEIPFSTTFTISNLGSAIRNLVVSLPSYLGISLPREGVVHTGFSYNSLMMISGFNALIGAYNMKKNGQRMGDAAEMGDGKGYVDAALSLATATAQAVGGVGVIAYSPLALASTAVGVNQSLRSTSLLGRVTYAAGQFTSAAFGVFYAFLGISNGLNIFHQIKFYSQYNKAKKNGDPIKFLQDQLSLTEKEKAKLNQLIKEHPEKLIEEAKKMLPKLCPDVKMEQYQWENCFDEIGIDQQIQLGAAIVAKKMLLKHEEQLKKVAGGAFIKELQDVQDLTSLSDDKKTAILRKVESTWTKKMVINTLLTFCAVFGVLTTIAGFFFTAGLPAVIITLILLTAVILPMVIADGYSLYVELKHAEPGKHDTKFLAFSSLISLVAMATSITLICLFGNFAILPILLTLAVGALWLGLNGFSYVQIKKKQKQIAEKKQLQGPTLNPLSEALLAWKDNDDAKSLQERQVSQIQPQN